MFLLVIFFLGNFKFCHSLIWQRKGRNMETYTEYVYLIREWWGVYIYVANINKWLAVSDFSFLKFISIESIFKFLEINTVLLLASVVNAIQNTSSSPLYVFYYPSCWMIFYFAFKASFRTKSCSLGLQFFFHREEFPYLPIKEILSRTISRTVIISLL